MRPDILFWDVDTQVDFMKADGKLYVPGSEEIIPTLHALTDYAHGHGLRVLASADDHAPSHRELSDTPDWKATFPRHCMHGTPGQAKIPQTALRNPWVIEPEPMDPDRLARRARSHDGDILFHKHWFDIFTNPNLLPVLDGLAPSRVVLYGVALDVCDKYAVEGLLAHRPSIPVTVVTDATRAIDPEAGRALLESWKARGVTLATADQVMAE